MIKNSKKPQKTIAFFIGNISHQGFQEPEWLGIQEEAERQNFRLLTLNGDFLSLPGKTNPANTVYRRIDTSEIQGIIFADELGVSLGAEKTREFFLSIEDIPKISLQTQYKDIPAVVPSNERDAMQLVVDHLVQSHGFSKIAYIRYPESHPSAKLRYEGFVSGLKHNGIALDPELMSPLPPDWGPNNTGITDLAEPFIKAKINQMEALIACDDWGAFWAADLIRSLGKRVPQDIAIAGFSDYPSSRSQTPALSTLRIPYKEMGEKAVELLAKLMRGETIAQRTEVPCQVMIRETCGCMNERVREYGNLAKTRAWFINKDRLKHEILDHYKGIDPRPSLIKDKQFSSLIDLWMKSVFEAQNEDVSKDFLQELINLSRIDLGALETFIFSLHSQGFHYLGKRASLGQKLLSLSNQTQQIIAEMGRREEVCKLEREEALIQNLNHLNQDLITAFDLGQIKKLLETRLKAELGIQEAHLVLFKDSQKPDDEAYVITGSNLAENAPARTVGAGRFLSPEVWDSSTALSWVVKPLFFADKQQGYILMSADLAQGRFYEILQHQLASALQGAALLKELRTRTAQLSSSIQEVSKSEENLYNNINLINDHMLTQANNVEAEAASLEEMVHNIDTIGHMSEASHTLARDLKNGLSAGMGSVRESVQAIREVAASSTEIINFLALIKDVSEKTGLLALNAAIQAAHAGQAGKSFSVVAEEIRKLADNTKINISSIEQVLQQINSRIERSVELSEKAGAELENINSSTEESAKLADQLNLAMIEQKQGAQDLLKANQGIVQITKDVKQAMVQQHQALETIVESLRKIRPED